MGFGNAQAYGNAWVFGDAWIYEDARSMAMHGYAMYLSPEIPKLHLVL